MASGDTFQLEPATGVLIVTAVLDRETIPQYQLTIQVGWNYICVIFYTADFFQEPMSKIKSWL